MEYGREGDVTTAKTPPDALEEKLFLADLTPTERGREEMQGWIMRLFTGCERMLLAS